MTKLQQVISLTKPRQMLKANFMFTIMTLHVFITQKQMKLIDLKWAYDQPLDLKDLVKVCATDRDQFKTEHATNHIDLVNYKEYGLSFRFYLAKAPYITLGGIEGNTNKTDQQKFAEIDNPTNGIMTSKVYTVGEGGTSATAVGREPIVRV